jgi:hypothetical protein
MKSYTRSHLADQSVVDGLTRNTTKTREATADQLADIGEFKARKLHLPAGYPSTHAYCVHELYPCEEAAYKRIYVARKARRFPAIFHAIADGRLHLSAVVMIGRHLTEDTAEELLTAVTHKTKPQIERLLAERFPKPGLPTALEPVNPPRPSPAMLATMAPREVQLSPGKVKLKHRQHSRSRRWRFQLRHRG